MICKKCNKPIAFYGTMCDNCYKKSGYALTRQEMPVEDKYEQLVYTVYKDDEKAKARMNYLDTLPEYIEFNNAYNNIKTYSNQTAKIFLFTIGFIILSFIVSFLLASPDNLASSILYFAVIFPIGYTIFYLLLFKRKDKNKKYEKLKMKTYIHSQKNAYYANQNVFGFVAFDHSKTFKNKDGSTYTVYYYAHYEIDKSNIKTIGYDSKYAEYVLTMSKPIYMHYGMEPTTEFRIADIFDDTVLSNALSCDLPPKHMLF